MELTKIEYIAIADVSAQAEQASLQELTDLDLLLVGGGSGEVIIA